MSTPGPPLEPPPLLPIGFNLLDIDRSSGSIRVRCDTKADYKGNITDSIVSWVDTVIYSARSNLDQVLSLDRDFQFGSFSTLEDHNWDVRQPKTTRQIAFPQGYNAPPNVILWLNVLDVTSQESWRFQASADDITPEHFVVNLNTWGDSYLSSARVSWIAFPSDRRNFASGWFSTDQLQPWQRPQQKFTQNVRFDRPFSKTPHVAVALNGVDFGVQANLRVQVVAVDITTTGFAWQINSWGDSVLYYAGGAYVATLDPNDPDAHSRASTSSTETKKRPPGVAILGAVIGGIVVLAFLFYCYIRYRNRGRGSEAPKTARVRLNTPEPEQASPLPTSGLYYSGPSGSVEGRFGIGTHYPSPSIPRSVHRAESPARQEKRQLGESAHNLAAPALLSLEDGLSQWRAPTRSPQSTPPATPNRAWPPSPPPLSHTQDIPREVAILNEQVQELRDEMEQLRARHSTADSFTVPHRYASQTL
jgi:hypothetical protein